MVLAYATSSPVLNTYCPVRLSMPTNMPKWNFFPSPDADSGSCDLVLYLHNSPNVGSRVENGLPRTRWYAL